MVEGENEINTSEIEKRASEIAEGRTGEEFKTDVSESPLEEVRRLNVETKSLLSKLTSENERLEKVMAANMIMGRGNAGRENKPKTQADIDKEEADKMLKNFI